jgi:hypothetical protein
MANVPEHFRFSLLRLQTNIERENLVPADPVLSRELNSLRRSLRRGGSAPRSPRIGPQNPPLGQAPALARR